jgi:hypothetical protein
VYPYSVRINPSTGSCRTTFTSLQMGWRVHKLGILTHNQSERRERRTERVGTKSSSRVAQASQKATRSTNDERGTVRSKPKQPTLQRRPPALRKDSADPPNGGVQGPLICTFYRWKLASVFAVLFSEKVQRRIAFVKLAPLQTKDISDHQVQHESLEIIFRG